MKKILFIMTLLLGSAACDYKEYPEEQEWKENLKESQEKMQDEKKQDPRSLDKEMEQEQDQREVKIERLES